MKILPVLLLSLIIFSGCTEEDLEVDFVDEVVGEAELRGILEHHNWEKSFTSYCARGSDYFMMNLTEGGQAVLKYDKRLGEYDGRLIWTKTYEIKRRIPCPDGSQCPIPPDWMPGSKEPDYECTIYEIQEIQSLD